MSDMLSAMIRASKKVANPIIHSYAAGNRPYQVRLARPHTLSTFDRTSLTAVNPDDEVLYTGPARFTRGRGGGTIEIGDEASTIVAMQCSINDYPGEPPRVGDIVTVLADADGLAASTGMLDRSFTIDSIEQGGHFDIGYVLQVQGVARSRGAV